MLPKPLRRAGFSCPTRQKRVAFPPAPCAALQWAHQTSINMPKGTDILRYAHKQKQERKSVVVMVLQAKG